jgi:hypothetical protein
VAALVDITAFEGERICGQPACPTAAALRLTFKYSDKPMLYAVYLCIPHAAETLGNAKRDGMVITL